MPLFFLKRAEIWIGLQSVFANNDFGLTTIFSLHSILRSIPEWKKRQMKTGVL